MKLLIVLSVIACSYAAKLDRTYLPPANAGSSGGSPGSLNTPLGPSGFGQPAGFGQAGANIGFGQAGVNAGFGQAGANTGFGQAGANAGFGQAGANTGFVQAGANAGYGQAGANNFGQSGENTGNNGFSSSKYTQPGQTVGPNYDAGFGAPAQNFGSQDYQRSQPQRAQSSSDQNAQILRSDSQNDGESFSYNFETSNGISAEESGVATNGVQAQGAFAYSSDDGQTFRVQYTADENGYQPQGEHLPTSPPIPDEILKSIEENARAAAAGTQEGAYNPEEDNDVTPQQYSNNSPTSYNQAPGNEAGPAQLYAAPNSGSRPQNPQAYSQGPQPQQYNAGQNSGSSRPSNAFSQSQTPSQLYGSPSNTRPNSFDQRPSKYSAGSTSFDSTGTQARPQQYQASSQFSSGRQESAQDASGYEYNKPQGFGNANAQQYRPNADSGLQGFSRPNGNSFPSSSNSQNFGASPNSQAFGSAPQTRPQSFSSGKGPVQTSSFGSNPQGPSSFGANAQTSYGAPNTDASSSFASNGFNKPQGNGFRSQAQSSQTMSGYEYNRPQIRGPSQPGAPQFGGTQSSGPSQFRGSSQVSSPQFSGSSQSTPQFGGSLNGEAQAGANSGPGQFGAPRAPPSFSEEEGYKY